MTALPERGDIVIYVGISELKELKNRREEKTPYIVVNADSEYVYCVPLEPGPEAMHVSNLRVIEKASYETIPDEEKQNVDTLVQPK